MDTPVANLTFQQQSFLLTECSRIAYCPKKEGTTLYAGMGFKSTFIDKNGSQAYVIYNDSDIIIACRGTEPTEFADIKADLNVEKVAIEEGVLVHKGFYKSVERIWPGLERALKAKKTQNIWVTGHSLGAAMATVVAVRLCRDRYRDDLQLFTYGSPRVGNEGFFNLFNDCKIKAHRFINNNDAVTAVPRWNFKHVGDRVYMNHWGNVREMTAMQRAKDRLRGFFKGLLKGKLNFFTNHSIQRYCDNLERWAKGEERPETEI